ncbi:MAG: ArsR family transcriptional regulator [Candidatus Hodarchaeales archaeon]
MTNQLFLKQLFQSTIRLEILLILKNSELPVSGIAKKLGDVSSPEVSRHLTALSEQGLVKRENLTRKYTISDFGKTLTTILEPIQFIVANRNYFQKHRLDDLPTTLMTQISLLSKAKIVERVGSVMLELEKLINITNSELCAIIDSGFTFKNDKVQKMDVITNPEFLYSTKHDEFVKTEFKKSYPSLESITYKVLPRIHIAILLIDKDKAGAIAFPKTGEFKPDYSAMFFTSEKDSINYIQTVFDYFWKLAQLP